MLPLLLLKQNMSFPFNMILLYTLFGCHTVFSFRNSLIKTDPEIYMNTTELVRSKGYPCEEYEVHTSDGYILQIQRIPFGKSGKSFNRQSVLLQHGLLSCSACWVENLENESLGFILADAGYDVWMGNNRGNTYGLKHEKFTPDQEAFWTFSFDEMATYDLSAIVDKVTDVTNQLKIFYVGHSQGTEIAFAALSFNQTLADKILLFVALGPAAFLGHVESPVKYLRNFSDKTIHDLFGYKDFLPETNFIRWLGREVCGKEIPDFLCENILFLLGGYDFKEMNATRIPVYVGQHPAGTSVQNMIHYAQAVRSDAFQMFDFGPAENVRRYNQTAPPSFKLENMRTRVALFSGTADWLTVPIDVARLLAILPNVVMHKVINGWEHLDFIWALNAPALCYNDIISLFQKYIDLL